MRIDRIEARGLKSGDFAHNLGDINLVVGPNFSGKTARLEAVRLALMGHLPELGKTRAATLALARNGSLRVTALTTVAGGEMITREWSKKSESHVAPFDTPPVLLDPSVYFDLGAKDRMRFVFGLLAVDDLFKIDDLLAKVKGITVEGHAEEHERAVKEVHKRIDHADQVRHDSGAPVQGWIEEILTWAKEQRKSAADNASRMARTIEGLSVLAGEDTPPDLGARIAERRSKLDSLRYRLGKLESELAPMERTRAERGRYVRQLGELQAGLVDPAVIESKITGIELQLDPTVGDLMDLAHRTLQASIARRHNTHIDLSQAQRDNDTARAKLGELDAMECCPTCQAKRKGWKDAVTKALTQQLEESAEQVAKIGTVYDRFEAEVESIQRQIAKLDARRKRHESVQAELASARTWAETARGTAARVQDIERLLSETPEVNDATIADAGLVIEDLKSAVGALATELVGMERLQRQAIAAQEEERRKAQATIEKLTFEAHAAVLAEVVKLLEAAQADLVARAFGTILDRANVLADGILPHRLEMRDGELGWAAGGTWVSHRTFSGTEKLLAYAGVALALAQDAPIKILLMDELGRLDRVNLDKLLCKVRMMIDAGQLDQFIGVCPTQPGMLVGLTVIEV